MKKTKIEINVSVIKSVFQPLFWFFPQSLQRTVWGISFQGEVEDILRIKVLTAWPCPATVRPDKPPEMLNRSVHHLRSEISHLFSLPSSWPAAPGSARAEINLYFLSESFISQLAGSAIFLLSPLCLRHDGGDSPVTAGPHLQHSSWEHQNLPDSRFYRGNSSKLTGRRMWPVGITNIMKTCCSNIRVEINSCHFSGALHRLQRQTDTWTTK